jgi:hypothetical protein
MPPLSRRILASVGGLSLIALLICTSASEAQISLKGEEPAVPFYAIKGENATADDLKPFFIVDKAHVWPTHSIEVCWEPGAEKYGSEMALVKAAVNTNIEQNSDFRFEGWSVCDQDQKARVRILVQDAPAESEVGYRHFVSLLSGDQTYPTHMVMNFTFQQWNKNCQLKDSYRRQCIATIAVHEFLHAVGALHETVSKDLEGKDPKCWAIYRSFPDIFGDNPTPLTAYDPDSIMNYCRQIYTEPTRLSSLDLVGLKKLNKLTGSQ